LGEEFLTDNKFLEIIRKNRDTEYGEKFVFSKIRNLSDFQKNLPITTYDDYLPFIEKIKNGEQNILTAEKVLLLEPSSGSTSAKKLIPYTKGLKREFSSAIAKWLWDLNKHFPRLKWGQMYFSITPQVACNNGIVGFAGDDEYIGGFIGKWIANKFVVPNSVKNISDMDLFWNTTINYIKNAKNLRFISIWNPTFLLIMLEKAHMNGNELFPDLEVISCWADGNSEIPANSLRKAFPNVYIQPKGLLATEGIMTIPIEGVGKRLTNSHFFEFRSENGEILTKDYLEKGKNYDIILSTSGGLYRYDIGDIVRYNGKFCFDFVGKRSNISDFYGEKLNENHVREILRDGSFKLLVPGENEYILYSENPVDVEKIEEKLRENFHYDYCRKLGQLRKVRLVIIKNGEEQYIENCLRFGMRLGDIKPTYLSNKRGWTFL
jgi:hypothetical protein